MTSSTDATARALQQESMRLGRYVLREAVGRGGFGIVYRGVDPTLRREVAVKLLRVREPDAAAETQALLREARMVARLDHPNVVRVFDVGRMPTPIAGSDAFVVMELLPGQSLRQWLRVSSRRPRDIVETMAHVADGLGAAHESGIVHCDVKPANVLFSNVGVPKVVDFGLALHAFQRMSDLLESSCDDEDERATPVVAGTPKYMAPEAHEGQPLSPASDQYSFAIMLVEALAGRSPFSRGSHTELYRAKRRGVSDAWLRKHVPRRLVSTLKRALSPSPHQRFTSMRTLARELREWARPVRVLPWIAGATVAAMAGSVLAMPVAGPPRCDVEPGAAGAAWTSHEATRNRRPPSAGAWVEGSTDRLERGLRSFAAAWDDAATHACTVPELPTGATACLQQQRRRFEAVLAATSDETDTLLQHADALVAQLGRPQACLDGDTVPAPMPDPTSPDLHEQVEQVRDTLSRARAEWTAADYAKATQTAKHALRNALALDFAPVHAEAMLEVGLALSAATEYGPAAEYIEQAYFAAQGIRHDAVAATAATRLVGLYGVRLRDEARGRVWVRYAQGALERIPADDEVHADFAYDFGKLEHMAGNREAARRALQTAHDHYAAAEQTTDEHRALLALGLLDTEEGELQRATQRFEYVLQARTKALGHDHPNTAFARAHVARAQIFAEDFVQARQNLARAIADLERSVGVDHASLGTMLGNIGAIEIRLGFMAAAREHLERALERLRPSLPEGHLAFAVAYDNIAQTWLETGHPAEAHELDVLALDIRQQKLPPHHPLIARSRAKISRALADMGRTDEAEHMLELAEEDLRSRPRTTTPGRRLDVVLAHIALGHRPLSELTTLEHALEGDHIAAGVVRFEQAKLLRSVSPDEARSLARQAEADFDAVGATPRRDAVREWLAQTP